MSKQFYPDAPTLSSGQAITSIADSPNTTAQIIHLLDRPIAFHRCFVTVTGSVTAALMLSQALYWQRRTKNPDGWWWKTMEEWAKETGLGRREQETARRKLRNIGVLEEIKRGVPAKLYFRVNFEALSRNLSASVVSPVCTNPPNKDVQNVQPSMAETAKLECTNPPTLPAQIMQPTPFNTETTSETTTTTTETALAQAETAQPDDSKRSSSSNQEELIFDLNLTSLSQEDRVRTVKTLEGLDRTTAQQVLDEFNEALGGKCIKKSKWAWLQGVARAAREGSFIPTSDLADRRQAQAQAQARAATAPAPERKPSQVWEEHHAELLSDGITPADYHTYITPLRGSEDGRVLWLEAPNCFAADWVLAHLPQIAQVMQPHTAFPIRVCIG